MPVEHTNIKPVIRELVRTQLCFPDIKLLVDRVIVSDIPITREEDNRHTYRLFLTDGEKTIQAVVRRRLHKTIHAGDIREGSIVVLKEYGLARAKKTTSDGEVIYLQIADFYSIGEDARQYEESPVKLSSTGDGDVAQSPSRETPAVSPMSHPQKRKRDADFDELDTNPQKRGRELEKFPPDPEKDTKLDTVPASDALEGVVVGRRLSDLGTGEDQGKAGEEPTYGDAHEQYMDSNPPSLPAQKSSTNSLKPITRPLKISSLASITGANRSKNEIHDVFALIVHVDAHTYKPSRMPRKRDLRIMDTSTSKRVVLSVFTDPVGFQPEIGTMALFRNLTTHDWDGGNLKAYPWLCENMPWFMLVPDDGGVEGVDREAVESLRELRNIIQGECESKM